MKYGKLVVLISIELGQKRLWRESINDIGHGVCLLVVTSCTHDALPSTREYMDANTILVDTEEEEKEKKKKRKKYRADRFASEKIIFVLHRCIVW